MPHIRICNAILRRAKVRTRMPFRYGIATMVEPPHVFLILEADINGKASRGIAADHLPPKWFTKNPEMAIPDEIAEMVAVIQNAAALACGIEAETPFAFWEKLYSAQSAWALSHRLPPLLAHFGTSLVERALLDAIARVEETPFHVLLRE
ncbi:MAG: hypothetical protein WCS43_17130, partial [Verrucomicrobiota bacterium]